MSDATDGAPSITLPSQKADYITHIALDLGGSLIKLVYFSAEEEMVEDLDGVTPPLARKPKLGGIFLLPRISSPFFAAAERQT